MTKAKFKKKHDYEGLLIVIEGTDGSGKSTQLELLKRALQDQSYGVIVSEWKTSRLIANVIDDAKERNLLNATTYSLLYAADFVLQFLCYGKHTRLVFGTSTLRPLGGFSKPRPFRPCGLGCRLQVG